MGKVDLREWDVLCDARSPAEYEDDHAPGARNFPVLDNEERVEVGTMHKQATPFEARRRGAALVAKNLHGILSLPPFDSLHADGKVLVYCARGGERSRSLAYVLSRVGWTVGVVDGGYTAYRAHVREALDRLGEFKYHVVTGPTGSAKGKLLDMLEAEGGQVIDLEGLANHKGSILGDNPGSPQPSQKLFESLLAEKAAMLDTSRPVFVESESNLVGKLHVPQSLFKQMQLGPRTSLSLPMAARVAWIRSGYTHFETTHVSELRAALARLVRLRSQATVDGWSELVDAGRWDEFVQSLLEQHYDPAYTKSRETFYGAKAGESVPDITTVELANTVDETYRRAALQLLARVDSAAGRSTRPSGAAAIAEASFTIF